MKKEIYPCIWFDGNAEAAAHLYAQAFTETEVMTSTPMVVTFSVKGQQFMGLNGGPQFQPNPSISFFVHCASEEELNNAWQLLSEDGIIRMPLDQYPWAERYGWVEDRYGVSWQLLSDKSNVQKPKVVPSLLFTGQQNGNARKAMDFYSSLFADATIITVSEYEDGEGEVTGNIKYAELDIAGTHLAFMDSGAQHDFEFNEGVSFVVTCDTQDEIDFYWLNITEGGTESNCGWCRDTFGVWWQVVPSVLGSLMSDPEKAPKVMKAFMQMKKFDIAALIKAADE